MILAVRDSADSSPASSPTSSSSGAGVMVSFRIAPSVALAVVVVLATGSSTSSATVTDRVEMAILLSSATARIAYSPASTLGTVTDDSNEAGEYAILFSCFNIGH